MAGLDRWVYKIRFTWVPAHVGVEAVDVLAKHALSCGDVDVVVSMSKAEVKCMIWTVMLQRWQEQWNRDTKGRHLFQVQRKVRKGQKRGPYFYKIKGHRRMNKTLHVIGKHPTGHF